MGVLVAFFCVFVIAVFLKYLKRYEKERSRLPPGPLPLPIIGNMHQIGTGTGIHHRLHQLSKEYGPLMWLKFGTVPTLIVSSARAAKEILHTHDAIFANRPFSSASDTLSFQASDIVFAPYGEYWREMRKITTLHLFSTKRVNASRRIFEDEVALTLRMICSAGDEKVNLSDMMVYLINSIICRLAFSKKPDGDDQSRRKSRFHALLQKLQRMITSICFTDSFPLVGWIDRITGFWSRLRETTDEWSTFMEEIINEHLVEQNKSGREEDMTDVLLEKKAGNSCITNNNQIKGVLLDIFVAGTDTSASTVIWAMTELMRNPEKMKRAQDEIRSLMMSRNSKRVLNEEEIRSLPYLNAVVKETFRLNPVVPLLLPHQSSAPCTIDNYQIPAGTTVYVNAWTIGRDPDVWENPLDFCPERFMSSAVDFRGRDFELIPFGAGRRICPGMHLGMAMVEVVLVNLLYWFDWKLPEGMEPQDMNMEALPGVAVQKKVPLELLAMPYERDA